MNFLIIKMLEYKIFIAKKSSKNKCEIVKKAYGVMIKNYQDSIMFLKTK